MPFLTKFTLVGVLCYLSTIVQQPAMATMLPPKALSTNTTGVCAADHLRAAARNDIRSEIQRILSNNSSTQNGTTPGLMLPQCCNDPTGWTQVTFINMTNSSYQCPSAFREIATPRRVCGRRTTTTGSCDGVTFSVNGARYSQVCGRIIAYQIGTPAAFHEHFSQGTGIESFYLEGISITQENPTQHQVVILHYAHAPILPSLTALLRLLETTTFAKLEPPCHAAQRECSLPMIHYLTVKVVVQLSSCCSYNSPPWFCRSLPQPTTNDLEVRICSDMGTQDDDVPFEMLEMYIK